MMKKINFFGILASILMSFSKDALAFDNIEAYENYLNSLQTLSGEFTQMNNKGQGESGTIEISRPGKMRLTYNPPSPLLIVADGKWLITKDRDADQVDYVSLENTPAAFILRPNVRFTGGDVEVINVVPEDQTTEITLVRKEEPEAGYITLVFKDHPISLKEWKVSDAQGVETRVILSKVKENINLPPELFAIESPNLIQQIF